MYQVVNSNTYKNTNAVYYLNRTLLSKTKLTNFSLPYILARQQFRSFSIFNFSLK